MSEASRGSFFKEVLTFAAIALLVVLPIRFFVAQPFIVSGSSMDPTFYNGEYLIVDELTYHFEDPKRGDVVVFRYPLNKKKFFIKRIIGLPGETVRISADAVAITTLAGNVETLSEPYIVNHGNGEDMVVTVADGEYFVMGDNRPASSDSRIWGLLPKEDVLGRALVRLLPFSRADMFPGAITN